MLKAVIFDLDGVLVSTDVLHYRAWKKLAEDEGITEYTEADNVRQRGVSRMASLEVVLEKPIKNTPMSKSLKWRRERTISMLNRCQHCQKTISFRGQCVL